MHHEKYNGEVLKQVIKNRVNMNIQKHMYTNFRERRKGKEMEKFPVISRIIPNWFEKDTAPLNTQGSRRKISKP